MEIHSSSESSSKTEYRNKIEEIFQNDTFFNSIDHHGHSGRNFAFYKLIIISSIINFDMLYNDMAT